MARTCTIRERGAALVVALAVAAFVVGVSQDSEAGTAAATPPAELAASGQLVDLTGGAAGEMEPADRLQIPEHRVLMVGDSTLAAVRNVTASQELFVGFEPVLDAEGCRRLVWPSCWSNTDLRVPNTVEEAILGSPGEVDIVVVMSGYNDWNDPFGSFVDTIMTAARSKGALHVVFLTLAAGQRPGSSAAAIDVYAENTWLLWASAPRHPDLSIADWRSYNQRSSGWMDDDGVHLTDRGAFGLADYLSRWVAHLDGRACPAPLDPGGGRQSPCPNPNSMARVPDIGSLYGV